MNKTYLAIDLKSFYASVECVSLGLDPLTTFLVVADDSRTDKTICLAVTPALKSLGIKGRPRLYEVKRDVLKTNNKRLEDVNQKYFKGETSNINEFNKNKNLKLNFITAKPRMKLYMDYSVKVYKTYLKWFSKEDILVYSIDEVFIDATPYLKTYKMTPEELTKNVILDILKNTGITATAGIGTNMYLAKIAMDILAKKRKADKNGVRIASLNEKSYKELMWDHKPLTDFWRLGKGYQNRLYKLGLETMGEIARFSLKHEDILFKTFGVNAELLIDHAWGIEPCTIKDIKKYKKDTKSVGSGQVLMRPYKHDEALLILKEMADSLSLRLVKEGFKTSHITLDIKYDRENIKKGYKGEVIKDEYERAIPKSTHASLSLDFYTNNTNILVKNCASLYNDNVKELLVRKILLSFDNLKRNENIKEIDELFQYSFLDENIINNDDEKLNKTLISLKEKYGNNIVIKGMNLLENATGAKRNKQVGGHEG